MRRIICAVSAVVILLAGCAGREAMPVRVERVGDKGRPVEALEAEIQQIDEEIRAKQNKRTYTTGANVINGVAGFFLLVPWFFMNFKDAEGTEIEALKQRKVWLTSIMEAKAECGTATEPTPAHTNPVLGEGLLKQPSEF
jgi:hypothetical protein